jgi:3D (Asp-Asp-Asp) domain-containing protein
MAPLLSRSVWRQLLVMSVAIVATVMLYEIGTFDSRVLLSTNTEVSSPLTTGTPHQFTATAYCKGTTTAAGVAVRTGIAASDPTILPVGSVVNITTGTAEHNGVYTMLDTGPKVQGRVIDIYMWSCHEALAFGRQSIELTVLRLGWNPENSAPTLVDRLFRRREANRATTRALPPGPEVSAADDETSDASVVLDPTLPPDGATAPVPADDASRPESSQTEPPDAVPSTDMDE